MRQWLIGLCVGCVLIMPSYATEEDSSPELLIKAINYCYEDLDKIGSELAKCILDKMEYVNNPHGYHVFFNDQQPSKKIERPVTLTIVDKYGDAIVCEGVAKEKIVFKECVNKKMPKEKELSINPDL